MLFEATRSVRSVVADWYGRLRRGEPVVSRSRRVEVGEAEGEGALHQEHVDFYKAELERRMGAAAGRTALRVAPIRAGPRADGTGMARILFVVPPLAGHVNPTVAVGAALAARGHDVAWTGHPDVVPPLLAPGARFVPVDDGVPAGVLDAVAERFSGLRGPAALRFLWRDVLIPLADTMLPGVRWAVHEVGPDALVVDQQAFAGAVVACEQGLPWATSATTAAELVDPLASLGRVADWVRGLLADYLARAGLAAAEAEGFDPRFSPHLVLAFTSEALVGTAAGFPAHYAFVGPAVGARPAPEFDWGWLDPGRPLVYVSLGSVNGPDGARFFAEAVAALGSLPVQAVVVAPPGMVADPPANVLVRAWVPQVALLARAGRSGDARRPEHGLRGAGGRRAAGRRARSATTSRSTPSRSWPPARACGCASGACGPTVSPPRWPRCWATPATGPRPGGSGTR